MTAPPVDVFDDDLLHEIYDWATVTRGRTYADEGRVRVLGSEPGLVKAVCRGSGRASYVMWVRIPRPSTESVTLK